MALAVITLADVGQLARVHAQLRLLVELANDRLDEQFAGLLPPAGKIP